MEKNIHEVLISNWTTVVIRARIEPIKGGGEVKYGGGKKIYLGERNRKRERGTPRVSPREQYSFL